MSNNNEALTHLTDASVNLCDSDDSICLAFTAIGTRFNTDINEAIEAVIAGIQDAKNALQALETLLLEES